LLTGEVDLIEIQARRRQDYLRRAESGERTLLPESLSTSLRVTQSTMRRGTYHVRAKAQVYERRIYHGALGSKPIGTVRTLIGSGQDLISFVIAFPSRWYIAWVGILSTRK
jgi:hypothetical protein